MNAYELALEQGRKELAEAQAQQRKIALRVSQLEAIVTQLQALIGTGNPNSPSPLFEPSMPGGDAGQPAAIQGDGAANVPLWKAIFNALGEMKGDFTVPQALHALERTGRTIESRNRLNIIRNTLIHREDLFGRMGTGHYFVRGFEKKTSEKEEDALPQQEVAKPKNDDR